MSYVLALEVPLGEAVVAVARAEVDAALVSLAGVGAGGVAAAEAVHDVRKRTKKLRALAVALSGTVPRSQWRGASRAAAEAARGLADTRDAQVRLATLTSLVADRQVEFAAALARAAADVYEGKRNDDETNDDETNDGEQARHAASLLAGVAEGIATWRIPDRFASLSSGLGDTYRDGRRRWRALASVVAAGGVAEDEDLHRWRRAVKYRWYHTRLLAPIAPEVLGAEATLLDEVGEALGVDHDLAVLTSSMAVDPAGWGGPDLVAGVAALADERRSDLRRRALDLGRQLYALPTPAHLDRLDGWWRHARRAAR